MNGIREYIYSLMVVAFAAGAIEAFAPSGEKNGLEKCVRFVTGLLVALVLLKPVYPLLGFISGILGEESSGSDITEKYEGEDARDNIVQTSADIITNQLCDGISRKTGIDSGNVEITLTLDTSDYSAVKIEKADAVVHCGSVYECEMVREYIESEIECPTEVRAVDDGEN